MGMFEKDSDCQVEGEGYIDGKKNLEVGVFCLFLI